MKLSLYNKKRDFKKTPEPKGKVSHKHKFLYLIQKHAASHLHYDFRLELNGVLLSWAVPKGPCLDPTVKRLAMHVEDHPVEYGHFEGIIPRGEYGGGTVMLWDEGKWMPEDDNPTAAYHKGHLHFSLKGEKLKGRWNLFSLKKADNKSWFLVKAKDKYAVPLSEFDITIAEPDSVLTGYTLDEIAANYDKVWSKRGLVKKKSKKKSVKLDLALPTAVMPEHIAPQLATLVDRPPIGDEWGHEVKFDGYRILAFKSGKEIILKSRNQRDWTGYFENIVRRLQNLSVKNCILDGEVVMLDEQHLPSFQLLQNAIGTRASFVYYIFDLLYLDQYNLMSLSLAQRKQLLQQLLPENDQVLRYSQHIIGDGDAVLQKACRMGLEGIVAKKMICPYEEKRSKHWLKIKCTHRQEFVIGGFTPPKRSRAHFGSLYLGYYDHHGTLKFSGNVGTGFSETSLKDIYHKLKPLITQQNPFDINPPGVTTATWVQPTLIAEVEFTEWTSEGILRHPSFKGLRADKPATAITRETEKEVTQVTRKKKASDIQLTNPDKLWYPEDKITKLEVAEYYDAIHEWILPYIIERPLTLVRCPQNYKECFFQKHVSKGMPKTIYGVAIREEDKIEQTIYIKDKAGLLGLVQMATFEIHGWGSRVPDFEHPDMITFDLDPSPEVKWIKIVEAARLIREHLQAYGLESFIKTTGGKGLHVVIPIMPQHDWDTVKKFAHAFVQVLVQQYPEDYIGEMSKKKRVGKIFVDYLRNQRNATAICAYSTRARPGAPVSVPVAWDELSRDIRDTHFNVTNVPKRLASLKKDPWLKFFNLKQKLKLN